MSSPVFVVSGGGAVNLIDIPTNVHARERFDQAVERGDLRIVDAAEIVEVGTMETGLTYRLKSSIDAETSLVEKTAADGNPVPAPTEPDTTGGKPPGDENGNPQPAPAADDTGATPNPAPALPKPKKSAGVEAWRAYAVSQGMGPDAAEAADKAALVEQFGS